MSQRSRPIWTESANTALPRFHDVCPAIARTMSTMPNPVPTSMDSDSSTITLAPTSYPCPKT